MALFGKKKEELDEYEDEDGLVEEERQDRKLTRKFKDLKNENKKKRKEPPKPWGKVERLIVLVVLVITILISGGLYLISRPNLQFVNNPGLSNNNLQINTKNFQFPKINFDSLNIFKEETIEIRKK